MATRTSRLALILAATALVAGPLSAARPETDALVVSASNRIMAMRPDLGLDARHAFKAVRNHDDEIGQTHVRFQQTYKGLRVLGGEAIAHIDRDGRQLPLTHELKRGIDLNVNPSLQRSEALAAAIADLNPKGAFAYEPTVELVVLPLEQTRVIEARSAFRSHGPNAEDVVREIKDYRLAYHVHTQLENGAEETAHTDYLIDAHSGEVLQKWDTLRTSDATGTASTQFSGSVSIHTNLNGASYELKDVFRPMNISTYNLNHATSGTGTLYTDADNSWGDGANYSSGGSTTSANGQTAAVDAHYGIEMTYDYYKNIHGRNGINNANKATYSRVHYSSSYDNAFWDDTCFCMTYGDGSSFKSLEAMDVAGHEMSHGVCANSANLTYSGESGGLNESNSDIFGNMVELYSKSGFTLPSSVANTNNCWLVGEQLSSTPLRYMTKPSKDGGSKDAWSSSLGSLDVHYSSGPNNRFFFFLSQGASATAGDYYSSYTPSGFTGVGPAKAAAIWYRALTVYMTSSTNYAAARTACMNAAKDLYGATSAEYAAVQNAYAAINVGSAAPNGVTVSVSPTTANVQTNATFQFTAAVTGSTNTTVTWTATGGTVSTSGLYTAPATAGTYTVKATSAADTTKSASATVTVTAPGAVSVSITPTTASLPTGGTQQFTAAVTGSTNTAVTWTATGGTVSSSGFYTAPATAGTYTVKATSVADTSKSASATVNVSTIGNELIKNGGFESGATNWTQTSGVIGTYTGQPAHGGSYDAWMCGYGSTHTDYVQQSVAIPAGGATLSFWLHIDSAETTTSTAYDTLKVQIINGTTTTTLATYSNLNKATGYSQKSFNLSAFAGKTVTVKFLGVEDSSLQTSFVIDDVSVK